MPAGGEPAIEFVEQYGGLAAEALQLMHVGLGHRRIDHDDIGRARVLLILGREIDPPGSAEPDEEDEGRGQEEALAHRRTIKEKPRGARALGAFTAGSRPGCY